MSDIMGGGSVDLSAVEAAATAAFGKTVEPVVTETTVVEPAVEAITETTEVTVEPVVTETTEVTVEPVVTETTTINPVWERALANVPDIFRAPIIEQIRTSERESQSAIEKARSEANALLESVPDEWRSFIETSKGVNATPEDLTTAWNMTIALRADPYEFVGRVTSDLKRLIDTGELTPTEAQRALIGIVNQAQQPLEQGLDLRTDEQREIAELKAQVTALSQGEQQRQQSAAQQQQEQSAQQYAETFITKLREALPGADDNIVQTVGYLADSLIQQSGGKATVEQAVAAAVERATSMGLQLTAPAADPVIPPVTKVAPPTLAPATSGLPASEPVKFGTDKDRADAMLKAGLAVLAQE